METETAKAVNIGRHKRCCGVCSHEKVEEIERDFISWKSPSAIATEYGLADRTTVYRHAHAFDLFTKRRRNVRATLEKIIERVGEVEAVVAAIEAHAKINAQGQWIDRSEHIDLKEMFERMSREELEAYARDGALPDWFTRTLSGPFVLATANDIQGDENVE
jgi:hypothetical protein